MSVGGIRARLLVVLMVTSAAATAQSFEVAVIRPHSGETIAVAPTGGRFYANVTLKYMIQVAYDVAPYQISGGPDWLDKEVWDVTAKAEGFAGEIPLEQLRPMLRELIGDRFQLRLLARKKDLPYFALLVDKKGSRLKRSTGDVTDFQLERGPVLRWAKVSMRSFASWLEPWIQADRVVIDETGLPGEYDLELRWSGQLAELAGPSIFTALREQLGMRLESRRGPIDTFVVEHAERPLEN